MQAKRVSLLLELHAFWYGRKRIDKVIMNFYIFCGPELVLCIPINPRGIKSEFLTRTPSDSDTSSDGECTVGEASHFADTAADNHCLFFINLSKNFCGAEPSVCTKASANVDKKSFMSKSVHFFSLISSN